MKRQKQKISKMYTNAWCLTAHFLDVQYIIKEIRMKMNFLNMKWKYIKNRKIEKNKTYNKDAYIQKVKNSSSITFIMNK